MAKIIMLCGKVCSGKTTYAKKLKKEYHAAALSCDDFMLRLFEECPGEKIHNEMLAKIKGYFYELAEQMTAENINVIFDFGFWTRSEREKIRAYFQDKGIEIELHYISISHDVWEENIIRRNKAITENGERSYYMDDYKREHFAGMFEEPSPDEIDVLYENLGK